MNIQTNIPLKDITTMKIGGPASYVADVASGEELRQIYLNSRKMGEPAYVIGSGSNLIAPDEGFSGVIIHNLIKGIDVLEDNKDLTTFRVGGGEIWDEFVAMTVERGLMGIEAMSGIPGTVGAAPVQNIGAYGQELADTFVSLEAYDTYNDKFVELKWDDCGFSYRHSIFRGEAAGRYIIAFVTITVYKRAPQPPFYASLQLFFDSNNITEYTVQRVRDAVLSIRADKLPDPKVIANSGSFFKNPIVEDWQVTELRTNYPDVPTYQVDEKHFKIPAGWLIENVDLKGKVLHGMKVHEGNAVVLINESATGYADLAAARTEVIAAVRDKFQIIIEQEPLELSATSVNKF